MNRLGQFGLGVVLPTLPTSWWSSTVGNIKSALGPNLLQQMGALAGPLIQQKLLAKLTPATKAPKEKKKEEKKKKEPKAPKAPKYTPTSKGLPSWVLPVAIGSVVVVGGLALFAATRKKGVSTP